MLDVTFCSTFYHGPECQRLCSFFFQCHGSAMLHVILSMHVNVKIRGEKKRLVFGCRFRSTMVSSRSQSFFSFVVSSVWEGFVGVLSTGTSCFAGHWESCASCVVSRTVVEQLHLIRVWLITKKRCTSATGSSHKARLCLRLELC